MIKVQQKNQLESLATGNGKKPNEAGNNGETGFKDLLGDLLTADKSLPAATKPQPKPDQTGKAQDAPEKPEEKPDEAASEAAGTQAVAAAAQPEVPVEQPTAEGAEETAPVEVQASPAGMTGQQPNPVNPELPQQVQSEEADAGGDILSVEVTAKPQDTEAVTATPIPPELQNQIKAEDSARFDTLLEQAREQLQEIAKGPEPAPAEQPTQPTQPVETPQAAAPTEEQVDTPDQQQLPPVTEGEPEPEETAEVPEEQPTAQKQPETQSAKVEQPVQKPATKVQNTPEEVLRDLAPTKQEPVRAVAGEKLAETVQRDSVEKKPEQPKAEAQAPVEQKPEPVRPETVRQPEAAQPSRPAHQSDQMEQIRMQVTENLERSNMEFRMQLQPESLGKVDVRMVLQDGRLAVEIMAANPKAAELLKEQAGSLLQSLRMQEFEVQTVNVVTETQSSSGEMGGAFNAHDGQAQDSGQQSASGRVKAGKNGSGSAMQDDDGEEAELEPETLLNYAV